MNYQTVTAFEILSMQELNSRIVIYLENDLKCKFILKVTKFAEM